MRQRPVVVGLGEILWDVFPDGARFGGAPTNFACSSAGIGREASDVYMVSAVGTDELGDKAIDALVEHGVHVDAVTRNSRPTGKVHVKLDKSGHASYEFEADAAWDRLQWSNHLEQLAKRTDIVCFGTLGQRSETSLAAVRRFVTSTPSNALRILDINIRRPFIQDEVIVDSLKLANVLKLNDEELPELKRLFQLTGSPLSMLHQLLDRFSFQIVALTRGSNGAILVRGNEVSEEPGVHVDVVDTVGAGDAFTAVLAIGVHQGRDLQWINHKACEVAAFVCSQSGATPKIPDRLMLSPKNSPPIS